MTNALSGTRTCSGAVLGSLAAGVAWSWLYGFGVLGSCALALAHAALGLGLGVCLAIAAPRARHGFATGLAAALALAGLAPAVVSAFVPPAPDTAATHALAQSEPRDALASRVAIIGLDGGDWSVIDSLIRAGELPNLAALSSRGRSAVLRSIEPTVSPVVWTSIFSGRPPEQHGIVDWHSAHSANRRTGTLWEMAGAAGLASLVVNVPGTWPPTAALGALVSGFPIPAPLRRAGNDPRLTQNLAIAVREQEQAGPLHDAEVATSGDGSSLHAEASLGGWLDPARRWRHIAIAAAARRGWVPLAQVPIAFAREGGRDRDPAVWTVAGQRIELARGAWSPWLATPAPSGRLYVRLRQLDGGALLSTPAFQDPRAPIHPYASSPEVQELVAGLGMYVVEPTGWKSVADPIARDAIFEHLVDVEEMHLRASLALREWRRDWRVTAHVITLPDRVSHAFWRFHRPEDYAALPADELRAHRDKVARAYRESDRLLGRLVAELGPETAVIVLSDHGFASAPGEWGGHRLDGMLIAAGPGIAPGAERLALSIYDVVPLALTLLGLPVAEDLAGDVPTALLTRGVQVRRIDSYETSAAEPATPTAIDETTEDQLRGLGYVE